MARHYSVRDFFRQTSNNLLERFFHTYSLFNEIDFKNMKESKPEELLQAWLNLPEKQRNGMDAILQEIFELGCEKGFIAIIDEAKWQMETEPKKLKCFISTLSGLPNHYDRAMTTFLDYSECWKGATRFYHADTLSYYWRKRKNMGNKPIDFNKECIEQLASMIRNYFHQTEGRGKHCVVEIYRRGELDYFFAYPEDYSQHSIEWVDGEFGRRPHNPAFEIVFIYSQKHGTLDLNFRGSNKASEQLQEMFAIAILKMEKLPPNLKDSRVYDLNPLSNRNFGFVYPIDSGIQDVVIKKIRLSSRVKKGERLTYEVDPLEDQHAIHNILEQANKSFPLQRYYVSRVELTASVLVDKEKPQKNTSFSLTYPNSCSLKYNDIGLKLRSMLETSGIEPKEATDQGEVFETVEMA
ncbi:MAG: hypothetical protein ABI597_02940 [Gammaproteobacteria bacterium]